MIERDINKAPPDREFLESHIDEDQFLKFVSTRSPVFKTQALPRSKEEAIDLMLERPNLIRRPILVLGASGPRGSRRVIFGFDRAQYEKL